MKPELIRISRSQTREFARLSGDWNPLHVDPLTARRTLFGGTVVHGMHATLAALDRLLAVFGEARALSSIHATYSASLHQDEEARLEIDTGSGDTALLRLHAGGAQAQSRTTGTSRNITTLVTPLR